MNFDEVMTQLESWGSEQTCKTYGRHGVKGKMFGVSYANLKVLTKKIKKDHDLAIKLWASENHDARIFATMIVDSTKFTNEQAESWVNDCDNYAITGAIVTPLAKSPLAKEIMEKWTNSDEEWRGQAGWSLLGQLASPPVRISEEELKNYLEIIEKNVHQSKNRAKYSMMLALICIGAYTSLTELAIETATRIGEVDIDHGDTNCKTPNPIDYIRKTIAYNESKKK